MNSLQAKQLSLPSILSQLGYKPARVTKGGAEFWYLSPFRDEQTPSFHTSFLGGKWIWNDFADQGGTVIDFIMRHERFTRVNQALQFLDRLVNAPSSTKKNQEPDLFSFQQQGRAAAPSTPKACELKFLRAGPICNPIIHRYLEEERCLPRHLLDVHLEEVIYLNETNGKEYFAFGMQNVGGGYEIRSASNNHRFKSALNGRDISVIAGRSLERKRVNLFEGMLDFLSLLALLGVDHLSGDSIIMHSLSSFNRTVSYLLAHDYRAIHGFLDNNRAGWEATKRFEQTFPRKLYSESELFSPYDDLNEALVANHGKRELTVNFRMFSD